MTKGFTLIELIVVIAIIGVLAAILVPSMIGYVSESKLSSANANAKLTYENAAVYATQCEIAGTPIDDQSAVAAGSLKLTGNLEPYEKNGRDMLKALKFMMGTHSNSAGYVTVIVEDGITKEAMWAKTLDDSYVGHYPGEASAKKQYSLEP